jgi:hypothetical protein
LMRHKSLDGTPYNSAFSIVLTKKRRDWIKHIAVEDVVRVTRAFCKTLPFG